MKPGKFNRLLRTLGIILAVISFTAFAGNGSRINVIPQQQSNPVSNRLIVKLKPARTTSGLSNTQIAVDVMRPFSADTLNQIQAAARVTITESHVISNGAHIIILQGSPDRQTVNQAIDNIRSLSDVEYVEEDRILRIQAIPNDTSYANLWGMQPVNPIASPVPGGTGNYGADFETAWDTNTGSGVVVAVVDTGITAHVDIVGAGGTVTPATGNLVSPGYTFISDCRMRGTTAISGCVATTVDGSAMVAPTADASDTGDYIDSADSSTIGSIFYGLAVTNSSWHGTHVSGTVAALGNNSAGVIGGAYSAKILPVRVLGKGGGFISDIAEGVRWAANIHPSIPNLNPAKVINLSLGGMGSCSTTEQQAIDAAVANGAVIVVAAGNSNADVAGFSPANCRNIISVAAIGRDGLRAAYSNYSSPSTNRSNPVQITVAAQGSDTSLAPFDIGIWSTINTGTTTPVADTYQYHEGTSMATPHVSAAVALILSRNPALSPAQVKAILASSVTSFPSAISVLASWDCATLKNCGSGILNAQFAVRNSMLPYSTATAVAASRAGGGSGGGCSIMPIDGNADFSLLFAMLIILSYSFRQYLRPSIGKK